MRTKRLAKRILSIALTIVLVMGEVSLPQFTKKANAEDGEKTIASLGVEAISNPIAPGDEGDTEGWTGSYVYYGKGSTEPIKYRVLDKASNDFGVEGGSLLLDCNSIWSIGKYHTKNTGSWSTSFIRSELNGNRFLDKPGMFTDVEKEAIAASTKSTWVSNDGNGDNISDGKGLTFAKLEEDKIFLLDAKEVTRPSYGYADTTGGDNNRLKNSSDTASSWWLRSFESGKTKAGIVYTSSGAIYKNILDRHEVGISPAFNIKLTSIIYSSFIESESGSCVGEPGSEYKLTILDDDLSIAIPNEDIIVIDKNSIVIPYIVSDSSDTSKPTQVSVVVTDGTWDDNGWSDGAVLKQYVKLSSLKSSEEEGTGSFVLDDSISGIWGQDYHVYIIAEDVNKEKETDYASAPVEVMAPTLSSVIWVEGFEGMYDGLGHGISVEINPIIGEFDIKYGESAENCDLDSSPKYTEPGIYTIYYKVLDDNSVVSSGSAFVKIIKGIPTPSIIMNGWIYGETGGEPSISGNLENGAVVYMYKLKTSQDSEYTEIKPSNVGEYTIRADIEETEHYQGLSITKDFTISKRPITVSGITAKNKIYDGTTKADLVFSGAVLSGKLQKDNLNVTATGYFSDANVGKNKTVTINNILLTGTSKDNYILAETGQQTVTMANIDKATITADMVIAKSGLKFSGQPQELVSVSQNIADMLEYTVVKKGEAAPSDSTYRTELPEAVNAGEYTVYYKTEGNDNWNKTTPQTVDVKIIPKQIVVSFQRAGDHGMLYKYIDLYTTDDTYGELPTPTWTNYEFQGWYSDWSYNKLITSESVVLYARDHSLCGKWKGKDCRLIFDAKGGECSITQKIVEYGQKYGELPVPYREGYTFKGWYSDKGNKVSASTLVDEGDADIYLRASWKTNIYTVTFDATGGSCAEISRRVGYDVQYKYPVDQSTDVDLPIPIRDGYDFVGWYDAETGGNLITENTIVKIARDHTLYARWKGKTVRVNFDANGGVCYISYMSVTYGSTYGEFPIPTRTGYSFEGWFTTPTGDEEIYSSDIVDLSNEITLYAHWIKSDVDVTGIKLNKSKLTLKVGEEESLIATVQPENATNKVIEWLSASSNVATVDSKGTVRAISAGEAQITVRTKDGKYSAVCVVTVKSIDIESISLNEAQLEITIGETAKLTATVSPNNATDTTIIWKSNNTKIAVVDEDGLITAIGVGKTQISAETQDGAVKAVCEVTVVGIPVETVTLDKTEAELNIGETLQLHATVTPDEATDPTVIWSSDNEKIAKIDDDGNICALSEGETIVKATTSNGIYAECFVKVIDLHVQPEFIQLSEFLLELHPGDTAEVAIRLYPENATMTGLTLANSDENVITAEIVDDKVIINAINKGEAKLTVSASNDVKASCLISVMDNEIRRERSPMNPAENIREETTKLYLVKGQKFTLPDTGWKSSDTKILSISKKNVVTAKKVTDKPVVLSKGSHIIWVYITKPTMKAKSITLQAGNSHEIKFDCGNGNLPIQWYSNAPDVATINEDGKVTAVGKGTATITAYVNGSAYTCKVKVLEDIAALDRTLHITVNTKKSISIKGVKSVTWVSDDDTIASVTNKNKLTANSTGETVLRTKYNGKEYMIHVIVEDPTIITTGAWKIGKNKYKLILSSNREFKIDFASLEQPVIFKSNKGEIAYMDADGVVHTNKPGVAKLTAKINGKTITITVNVS